MNLISCEKLEKSMVELQFSIDAETFKAAVNNAFKREGKKYAIPGFRKGKAPRHMIEKMYGSDIFHYDAVNDLFPEAYEAAVKEAKIDVVGRPDPEVVSMSEADGVVLKVKVAVKPEVELGEYAGLTVTKEAKNVNEADVDAEVKRMQDRNGRLLTREGAAENGDTVDIDFEGFVDGKAFEGGKAEHYSLVLGSGSFIPGFEEQVVGMSAGEEKDIDVTFPEEYHAKELAGKPVVFHVKVNSITVEHIPAKDDEFAKDVSEFDTLDELRADIRTKELEERTKAVERTFETAAVEKAAENATMEMPESLVEEELDRQMNNFAYQLQRSGMSMEQYAKMMGGDMGTMRKAFRPAAEKQAKVDVTLQAIIKAEGLEVSDEEVEAEYQSLADTYQMELEKVKALAGADSLRQDLLVRKAAKLVAEAAVPVAPKAEEEPKTEE